MRHWTRTVQCNSLPWYWKCQVSCHRAPSVVVPGTPIFLMKRFTVHLLVCVCCLLRSCYTQVVSTSWLSRFQRASGTDTHLLLNVMILENIPRCIIFNTSRSHLTFGEQLTFKRFFWCLGISSLVYLTFRSKIWCLQTSDGFSTRITVASTLSGLLFRICFWPLTIWCFSVFDI